LYTVAYPLSFVHSCEFVGISPFVLSLLIAVASFLTVGVVVLDTFMCCQQSWKWLAYRQ